MLRRVLRRLKKVDSDADHGHEHFGAYSTHALPLVLQREGIQLYSDLVMPNSESVLNNYFEHIGGVYAVETIVSRRVKAST
ncbi:hypothetical protein ON010_g3345 [Phytophthora cinnamomi]|nr:hypothetical protein ON010_g3345 [Phytophthora cinnamomi]